MMRTSITFLLCALTIACASPTLPPRACTTVYPNNLQSLVNTLPGQTFFNQAPPFVVGGVGGMTIQQDNTGDTLLINPHLRISQLVAVNNPQLNVQFVDFIVPSGAYGCQLSITDQANQLYYESNGDVNAAPPALNVISLVPNAISGDPTYDVVMMNQSLVSSYNFGTVTMTRGGSKVINSFECPQATWDGQDGHLQYVFEFAPPGPGGYSDWVLPQLVPDAAGVQPLNGVYMTYNC
jgi:hypothetical protein